MIALAAEIAEEALVQETQSQTKKITRKELLFEIIKDTVTLQTL
jgi:hypothetical protein